ncbi:MAG: TlpA family protein disulfide reductase [Acidimicrobiia bacterium]|nr:TlpA family protein disulfide reductase [Acidimicrobiia bacterium]
MTRRQALLLSLPGWVMAQRNPDAPPFRAKTLGGELVTPETIKNKVALIQFWTTWCGVCRADQAAVDEITRKFKDKGLIVLAVSVQEDRETVSRYLQKSPREPKIVLTADTNLVSTYRPRAFPSYLIIDRQGRIAGVQEGGGGEPALLELLRKAGIG